MGDSLKEGGMGPAALDDIFIRSPYQMLRGCKSLWNKTNKKNLDFNNNDIIFGSNDNEG